MSGRMKHTELAYGEAYRTTKAITWSDHDNNLAHVRVPADELLIFRSFVPHSKKQKTELALFVWLNVKKTICLMVSEKQTVMSLKHVDWDKRHESLGAEREDDDTIKIRHEETTDVGESSDGAAEGESSVGHDESVDSGESVDSDV